jgi:hypothetical protein
MTWNDDFKRGFMVALGAVAALYIAGLASGVFRRVL